MLNRKEYPSAIPECMARYRIIFYKSNSVEISPLDTHHSQSNVSGPDKTSLKATKHQSDVLELIEFHNYFFF